MRRFRSGRPTTASSDSLPIGKLQRGSIRPAASWKPSATATHPRTTRGATWNSDGVIVFGQGSIEGLSRVSATGGPVARLTELQPGENSHRWPFFLPDGRHFLYFARGEAERRGIYVSSLDGAPPKRLLESVFNATFVPGYLLTLRDRALLAYPFDDTQLRITGDPVRVAERVAGSSSQFASFSAVSGVLAYGLGLTTTSQLVWVDRSGKPLGFADPQR